MTPIFPNSIENITSFSVSPNLPNGLIFNTITGEINGTPSTSQLSSHTITASRLGDFSSFTIQVKVNSPPIIRSFATFTDMLDGTIKVDVKAGIFGGQIYSAKTLYFAKCTYGQLYRPNTNSCEGDGSRVKFCTVNDDSCNGGNSTQLVVYGPLFESCNSLNTSSSPKLGDRVGWRVPTKNELKLLIECLNTNQIPIDNNNCNNTMSPTINNFFPNTFREYYWSSSTFQNGQGGLTVRFETGGTLNYIKTGDLYVRCVTDL